MSILEQFLSAIDYRINEAWEHQWPSYTNGQTLGLYNEYAAAKIIFNRENQEVIEISVASELEAREQNAYRWINPDYLEEIQAEAERRGLRHKEALEGLDYVELDVIDDLLEKAVAMLADEEFDKRVDLPLDLDEDLLMKLFRMAHEQDITLNQLMEKILLKAMEEEEE